MKIEMIPNWKAVLLRSYSMWLTYLGLALMLVPEFVLFGMLGIETNPYTWGMLGVLMLIVTPLGRVVRQISVSGHWSLALALAAGLTVMGAPPPAYAAPSPSAFLAVATPLVAKWEGKKNTAYLDVVGVPTICYGHTRTVTVADVRAGLTWTDARCETLLRDELLEYRAGLHRYFTTDTLTARLTPERDAAYSSLAFNVGIRGAGRSTATRRLNAGNIAGGCKALTWWNRAGGRVWRGLVQRRADEYRLCMMGA